MKSDGCHLIAMWSISGHDYDTARLLLHWVIQVAQSCWCVCEQIGFYGITGSNPLHAADLRIVCTEAKLSQNCKTYQFAGCNPRSSLTVQTRGDEKSTCNPAEEKRFWLFVLMIAHFLCLHEHDE